jgi:hypothetical protein
MARLPHNIGNAATVHATDTAIGAPATGRLDHDVHGAHTQHAEYGELRGRER